MAVIGMDLGGTKLSSAIFTNEGTLVHENILMLEGREGEEAGRLITGEAGRLLSLWNVAGDPIISVGVSVPGIYHAATGRVWAPNIPGWDDYPLKDRLDEAFAETNLAVSVDSDRACYILGETWKGAATNCSDAIFIAVGTGIGAGILSDGRIIRGQEDIAGAAGWMALTPSFREEYRSCGCFEFHTSGPGLVKEANNEIIAAGQKASKPDGRAGECNDGNTAGEKTEEVYGRYLFKTPHQVFSAYENNYPPASRVLDRAVVFWGMAAANLVSIFNPEAVIFGGGVFGPAARFLERIRQEAEKWGQPVSMKKVRFGISSLEGRAGLWGAGRLALMAAKQ